MGFLNKNKIPVCKICKTNPGHRFCLQKGKDICWKCCNEIRILGKCPTSCRFHIADIPDDLLEKTGLAVAVDSLSEYEDLQKRFIDLWVLRNQKVFDGEIPIQLIESEAGKDKIKKYLSSININESAKYSYNYLLKRLKLNTDNQQNVYTYETTVKAFFEDILTINYDKITSHFLKNEQYKQSEFQENFIKRLKNIKEFKKMSNYFIVGSGITKDGNSAIVHAILNNKINITLTLVSDDSKWKIANYYFGEPNLVNSESEVYKNIALLLNKNQKVKALEMLDEQVKIFPNSADIQYYYGIYFLNFSGNFKKAVTHYFNSIEIDPDFSESYFGLATAYLLLKDSKNAIKYYELAFEKNKEDFRALNNLASIYFEEGDLQKAKDYVEKALKLKPDFDLAIKNKERIVKSIS